MLNESTMIGRLVKDADLRYTSGGHAVLSFTIAVDRARKDAEGNRVTDFFRCVLWGVLAEKIAGYMDKGKLVAVTGEVHKTQWTDNNGTKHNDVEIACDKVKMLSPKPAGNSLGNEVDFSGDDIPF